MQNLNEKTSTKQYERLVELLHEKPDVARNFTKRTPEEVAEFWLYITGELNKMGPRQRDIGGWKKVWSDYKTYIKKKKAKNAKENKGTGGGVYKQKTFTALEEAVIALISMNDSIEGIGASSYGEQKRPESTALKGQCGRDSNVAPSTSGVLNCEDAVEHNVSSQPEVVRKPLSSIQILTKQVENQQLYFETMTTSMQSAVKSINDITSHLKRVSRSLDNLCDLEKKKIKEIQSPTGFALRRKLLSERIP